MCTIEYIVGVQIYCNSVCLFIFCRCALTVMFGYIKMAQNKLSSLPSATVRQNEAGWFLKIAWNLALQCGENYQEMSNFFTACFELSSHVQVDSTVLQRQKTCQLMAAVASLQVARSTTSDEERVMR